MSLYHESIDAIADAEKHARAGNHSAAADAYERAAALQEQMVEKLKRETPERVKTIRVFEGSVAALWGKAQRRRDDITTARPGKPGGSMATLKVYGASDDLIELRCDGDLKVRRNDGSLVMGSLGGIDFDEEFGAWCGGHPYKGRLVVQNHEQAEIAYVHCWYDGTWCFAPGHQHEGQDYAWPFPPATIGPCKDEPYSTQLTMELPDGCTVSFDPAE